MEQPNFRRENAIDENYSKAISNLNLNITKNFNKDLAEVFLTVERKQEFESKKLIEVKVTTAGVFRKDGEISEEALTNFCDINAPAIIFTFIRETISSLSIKSGLQPIIIQPVNFVELNKQEK